MRRLIAAALLVAGCSGHATMPVGPPPEKTLQVNAPGKLVDIPAILTPGYVTVVDFWAEWCGACVTVGGMLAVQVAHEPRVVIRKIDVGDVPTPVGDANDIRGLPRYKVFDKHGRMRADLAGNDCLKASEIAIALAAED